MSKIILSKTKFIKLIFISNINYLGELLKLKNNIPLFSRLIIIKNYSILIINKNLMDLLEDHVISLEDLNEFSEELRKVIIQITER